MNTSIDGMNMDEDHYIDDLYCTLCFHDLNDHVYHIHSHPILHVAICECCYEDISKVYHNESGDDLSSAGESMNIDNKPIYEESKSKTLPDLCIWCFQDKEAFICDQCDRNVCKDCIRQNLDNSTVERIENEVPWLCYSCNPEPIQHLQKSCQQAIELSIYNNDSEVFAQIRSELEVEPAPRDEYIIDGIDYYHDIFRLRILLQEENFAGDELNEEALDKVRKSFMELVGSVVDTRDEYDFVKS